MQQDLKAVSTFVANPLENSVAMFHDQACGLELGLAQSTKLSRWGVTNRQLNSGLLAIHGSPSKLHHNPAPLRSPAPVSQSWEVFAALGLPSLASGIPIERARGALERGGSLRSPFQF